MTSLHWVEFRFLAPPPPAEAEPVESRCSAISSEMKVFRSTSWSPLRLLRHTGVEPEEPPPPLLLPLTWVGDPGAPERTLMLAMAPLRPSKKNMYKKLQSDTNKNCLGNIWFNLEAVAKQLQNYEKRLQLEKKANITLLRETSIR